MLQIEPISLIFWLKMPTFLCFYNVENITVYGADTGKCSSSFRSKVTTLACCNAGLPSLFHNWTHTLTKYENTNNKDASVQLIYNYIVLYE